MTSPELPMVGTIEVDGEPMSVFLPEGLTLAEVLDQDNWGAHEQPDMSYEDDVPF